MRSSGSRVDIAQKPNKSGQILDQRWKISLVIFTKLIPRRIFFVLQKFWCWWFWYPENPYPPNLGGMGSQGRGRNYENNSDHPHHPYLQKMWPQNMPYNGGPYGIKVGKNQGISTEDMACGPKNMACEPPPFDAIWTVFIGGEGGLSFAETSTRTHERQ